MACFFREGLRRDMFTFVRINRPQKSYVERARRTQARSGRNIRHADHFNEGLHVMDPEGLAYDRMVDAVNGVNRFQLGVLNDEILFKGSVERDVNIAVYRGRNDETSEAGVVGWKIGPTATNADA